jgi:hypothetical protein
MSRLYKVIEGHMSIGTGFLWDVELGLKGRGMLVTLMNCVDYKPGWVFSEAGIRSLFKTDKTVTVNGKEKVVYTEGRDSIRKALEVLEGFGYLLRVQNRNKHGVFSGYDYYISSQRQNEFTVVGKSNNGEKTGESPPLLENPTSDKPITDNPTQ